MIKTLTKEVAKRVADIISDHGYNVKLMETKELNGTPRISLSCNKNADAQISISPTVHLTDDDAYEATKLSLEGGITTLATNFLKQLSEAESSNISIKAAATDLINIMSDRNRLLANVTMMLVNEEANKDTGLVMVPTAGDLAYIFTIPLPDGSGHVKIRPQHLAVHGISSAELFEAARINTELNKPAKIGEIAEFIPIPLPNESPDIYVVTTSDKYHGAVAITYPNVIKQLTDKLGDDFIVIPCSIHEGATRFAAQINKGRGLRLFI